MSKRPSHKRYALKPLNNAMRDVIVRKRWANRIQDVRIVDDWEQVVGALMATHVVPQWIKNRVLYVQASDPHWATFVTYEKPKIVEKINQHFTENTVENIVVITKETHKPSQSKNLGL